MVGVPGRLLRLHADLDPGHLGERLQQRTHPLDHPSLGHADHRHGRTVVAVPGHLRRHRCLHGCGVRRPPRGQLPRGRPDRLPRRGHRGRGAGAPVPAVTRAGIGAHDVGGRVAVRQHGVQRHLGDRWRAGNQPAVEVAGHQRFLRFQRPCHVHPRHGRAHRRCGHRAAGAQGDRRTQPGSHAGERDGDGGAGREPDLAAHRRLCALRSDRGRSAASSTAFNNSTCRRWTGTPPSRWSWWCWL